MKKRIILLPLLALALTACDLSDLMGGGNNNGNRSADSIEKRSVDPNDAAIKIADQVSVFPEVGDELDLSEYISFDTGTDYKLSDFTFESTNKQVISISNYHARCLADGYTTIKVSGPGLNTPVEVSFYVGSIAGNYVPDSKALDGVINLNIVKGEQGYSFALNVTPNGKQFNKRDIVAYEGGGALIKNLSPFVPMEFDGAAPSSFSPITSFLSDLGLDPSDFEDLTQDIYGFMQADPDEGVLFKMRFNEKFITLAAE